MKLEVGKNYRTNAGNTVQCEEAIEGEMYRCRYIDISVQQHRNDWMGKTSTWYEDGLWHGYPTQYGNPSLEAEFHSIEAEA